MNVVPPGFEVTTTLSGETNNRIRNRYYTAIVVGLLTMCRAIVADKCAVSNTGLCLLLGNAVGFTDVESIASTNGPVRAVETNKPIVLVMNIITIGVRGFDVLV